MNKDLKKLTIGISIILILSIASIFAYKNYKQERTYMMARITLEKGFKLTDEFSKELSFDHSEKTENERAKEEQENSDLMADMQANDKELKSYMKELSPKNERKINKLIAEYGKKASRKILKNLREKNSDKTQKTPENQKEIAQNRRSQYLNKEENQ